MSNKGNTTTIGKIPRAGINKFASVFARHGRADAVDTELLSAEQRVLHEPESRLPVTLVPGLVAERAPLRAARGDDGQMSQPPQASPDGTQSVPSEP